MEHKALGRGLSALIPEKFSASETAGNVRQVKISLIRDNALQPRTNYDPNKLAELKASIKEKGLLQPILVREKQDGYEVIAGERRLKAARELNLGEIPVIVKDVTDQEALVLALIENIQREELNAIEEAESYKKLINDFSFTQETVAQSVGKDRSTIGNLLRLLKLPENIKKGLYKGEISVGHARALLSVEDTKKQTKLYGQIIKKGLSVRDLERLTQTNLAGKAKEVIKKRQDVVLLQDNLQKLFGTKVNIVERNKKGKIVIDFYSFEDLERIVKILIKTK